MNLGDQRKRGKLVERRSGRRREGREGAELSPISAELRWSGILWVRWGSGGGEVRVTKG